MAVHPPDRCCFPQEAVGGVGIGAEGRVVEIEAIRLRQCRLDLRQFGLGELVVHGIASRCIALLCVRAGFYVLGVNLGAMA
jgi:hypothetical protein